MHSKVKGKQRPSLMLCAAPAAAAADAGLLLCSLRSGPRLPGRPTWLSTAAASCSEGSRISGTTAVAPALSSMRPVANKGAGA